MSLFWGPSIPPYLNITSLGVEIRPDYPNSIEVYPPLELRNGNIELRIVIKKMAEPKYETSRPTRNALDELIAEVGL